MSDPNQVGNHRRRFAMEWSISLGWVFGIVLFICCFGCLLGFKIEEMGPDVIKMRDVFYYLYCTYEWWFFLVFGILSFGIIALSHLPDCRAFLPWGDDPRRWAWNLAWGSFFICLLGTFYVYGNFPLCMDEFWLHRQAEAFAQGMIKIPVPESLQDKSLAVTAHMRLLGENGEWYTSPYLPVYSSLLAPFKLIQAGWLLNPLLTGLTVWLTYRVARLIWPESGECQLAAVLSTGFSAQFLITGMSLYSMPAYPALHLVWLWLFYREKYYVLPWLGLLIMGVHQPVVHALFIWPFVLRLVWNRSWIPFFYQVVIYLGGCFLWWSWMKFVRPGEPMGGSPDQVFHFFPIMLPAQVMAVTKLLGWNLLLIVPMFMIALFQLKRLSPMLRDLAYGIVSVFIVYCFFRYTQGHGWGGRYFHPNFPALIFVAIGGWKLLFDRIGAKPAWNLMAFSLIIAVLVQLPGRSWQVRDFSGHWQRAVEKIARQDAEVVILDTTRIFYGLDLVRNDLFLDNVPLVFYRRYLTMDQIDKLKEAHDVKELQYQDFESLGLMEAAPPRSAAEETHFFNPRGSTPWRGKPTPYDPER